MSRRESSRITPVLQRQYREAARAGDWVRCRILAEQMRGLERDNALAAGIAVVLAVMGATAVAAATLTCRRAPRTR